MIDKNERYKMYVSANAHTYAATIRTESGEYISGMTCGCVIEYLREAKRYNIRNEDIIEVTA